MKAEKDVNADAFDRSESGGDVLYYVTYLMLDRLRSLILSCDILLEAKEW